MINSLEGIEDQSKNINLKLFIFKMEEEYMKEATNNFYLEPDNFYCSPSLKKNITGATIRKEVQSMFSLAKSDKLIKIGNPARMLVNTSEDLMVVL